ncbi:MAG: YicC family protein [Clostridia bacterium]|nr:YicC family protein [Clostridia bacterium]
MIKSMTGFGRGEYQEEGKEFLVEIKTVNHRYSDIFVKMPRQISFLEDKVREIVGKSISRGKVDVYISYEDYSDDSKNVLFDEPLAKTYIKALETLREKYNLKDDITVSLVARFPDVLRVEKNEEDGEKIWLLLKKALEKAVESLLVMRQNEGKELKNNLLERANYIEEILKKITERSPNVVKEYRIKLENRLKELLEQQTVDESRMATEVAIFADRCSIDEEIVRLGSHISQLREALNMEQPVGRKLDFLIQEMNREINTIGSKANDLVITKHVVEIKSELEKVREQIQNIE